MKNVSTICLNCGGKFHGNFCNRCGQDAHTGKIDSHFLWHDVQHSLFHIDKGIFFTLRQLFYRPGYMLREFLNGKRVRHFRPLQFLLIIAGIYAFTFHFINHMHFVAITTNDIIASDAIEVVDTWSKAHYAIVVLLELPVLSLTSFMLLRKYGNSYLEHLIINTYLSGQRIVIRLLLTSLLLLPISIDEELLNILYFIIPLALITWSYIQFYALENDWQVAWRIVSAFVINYAVAVIGLSVILTVIANL